MRGNGNVERYTPVCDRCKEELEITGFCLSEDHDRNIGLRKCGICGRTTGTKFYCITKVPRGKEKRAGL